VRRFFVLGVGVVVGGFEVGVGILEGGREGVGGTGVFVGGEGFGFGGGREKRVPFWRFCSEAIVCSWGLRGGGGDIVRWVLVGFGGRGGRLWMGGWMVGEGGCVKLEG